MQIYLVTVQHSITSKDDSMFQVKFLESTNITMLEQMVELLKNQTMTDLGKR